MRTHGPKVIPAEAGIFHTFCHAGPMFKAPIEVSPGERVEREGFHFIDLAPRAVAGP